MLNFVLRRLLYSVPVVFVASFLLFMSVRLVFDPTERFATSRDPQAITRFKQKFGLDRPLLVQYGKWLGQVVRGDLGISSSTYGSVAGMLRPAFFTTVQLLILGVLVSALLAVGIGVYSAVRQYSVPDYVFSGLSYVGLAMPPAWFGLMAIQFLSVTPQRWFGLDSPPFGFLGLHTGDQSGFNVDYLRHLVLPVLTLSVQNIASWSRFQRTAMLDVLNSDYVRTARAKGVPRRTVIVRHALRNALTPLVTVMAVDAGLLFGGLVITESVFSIPGMGRLLINALESGDAYVVMAWLLVVGLFVVLFNLLADVLYALLDPRVRLS